MQRLKKGLASLLVVLMLASVLPAAAMAEETDGNAAEEVVFNLGTMDVTVGSDLEKYEEGEVPYDLFDEDGNYTMDLGPDAFFPYEVQFTCGGATWTEWFMDADDTVEVGGHIFSVETYVGDPAALTGLSFEIGGRTVIAYPEEKEFTNDGPGIALWSLLPIKENRDLTLDMRGYLPSELKSVPVSAVLSGASISAGAEDLVVWAKGYRNDDYTIVGQDGTMDLAPENRYNSSYEMELIVGSRDQLDMSNVRNILTVYVTPSYDLFNAVAYTNADPRQPIAVYDSYLWERNSEQTILQLGVDPAVWTFGDLAYLSLGLDAAFNSAGLDAVVYQGLYDSQEAAVAAGAAVISDIWDQTGIATEGGHLADYGWKQNYRGMVEITVVLKRGDSVALVQPMILYMYEDEMSISFDGIYVEREASYINVRYSTSSKWDNTLDMQVMTIGLKSGYPANGTYCLRMNLYNPADDYMENSGIAYVRHAAVGYYSTAEQIQAQPDIKAQLFSDSTGYPADYSGGVVFSVLDTNGDIHWMKIVTSESAELPSAPRPDSQDTYFRMNGASVASGESTRSLSAYVMPYEHDGYYYNGYQTVFLLDSGNTPVTADEIIPVFDTGTGVTAYAGHDKSSGDPQASGTTEIPFRSGEPVHYSASAESKGHLKNYWVTFLTQQTGGPKLFVNAANDPDRVDEDTGLPVREVYLTEEFGKHQDVFFANIGDADMTGVYVRLEDAVNVALDDYWTVREDAPAENRKLGAFDSTYDRAPDGSYVSYGELANVAKVRLVPTPDSEGPISGTLVIGHDGGEEVKIKLIGASGPLKITTETIRNGVKYVPFNSVIQTNSMGASDAVTFTKISGSLPTGVELQPNGKLYGMPTEMGAFTFTVRAAFSGLSLSDTKTFTITILNNTDTNVDNATDDGYMLLDRVPASMTVTDNNGQYNYQNQVFRSEGTYAEFLKFFLDGRELAEGTDFDSEEGSTKITIRAQTFQDAGGGTHTIAAEFRTNADDTNTVKRAAQNYTVSIQGGGSGGGSSSGGSSSGGSSGGATKPSVKPQQPDKTKPSTTQPGSAAATFQDVSSNNWFYSDVEWAYQNKLMIGVTKDLYKPYNPISPAMVVTVLSRMDKVDLSQYAETAYEEIAGGQWYTAAAVWAKEAGLLPEGPFVGQPPMGRGQMAVMLVKYLKHAGIDCTLTGEPVVFADADLMTPEENEAFQVLYQFGIFKGIGNYTMDVAGATTRAQLAVLMHRVSVFVESHKK